MPNNLLINHTFQKQQKIEILNPSHQGERFFRKGKVGGSAEELEKEVYDRLMKQSEDVYKRLSKVTI